MSLTIYDAFKSLNEIESKIEVPLTESKKLEEMKVDEDKTIGEFDYQNEHYYVEGRTEHSNMYAYERVWIQNKDFKTVAYGTYRWLNRPWERFKYQESLVDALFKFFNRDKTKEEIKTISDTCSDVNETLEKVFSVKQEKVEESVLSKDKLNKVVSAYKSGDMFDTYDEFYSLDKDKTIEVSNKAIKDSDVAQEMEIHNIDELWDAFKDGGDEDVDEVLLEVIQALDEAFETHIYDENLKESVDNDIRENLKKFISKVFTNEHFEGCWYSELGHSLYLVFAYNHNKLCAKIAYNCDDLQCDYDWDWYEPTIDNETLEWEYEDVNRNQSVENFADEVIDAYNYILECGWNESMIESLNTSKEKLTEDKVNLNDEKAVKDAVEKSREDDTKEDTAIEIVDVDSETVSTNKDDYIGKIVLICDNCGELILRDRNELKKEADGFYNEDIICPHCGLNKWNANYQLQTVTSDEQKSKEENAVDDSVDNLANINTNSEEITTDVEDFDSIDEELFSKLATSYITEVYENADSFKTTSCKNIKSSNKLIVSGDITFKDKNTKSTEFIFESQEKETDNKLKFVGYNKTFTVNKDAFTMICENVDKTLKCCQLDYSYSVKLNESVQEVKGTVSL